MHIWVLWYEYENVSCDFECYQHAPIGYFSDPTMIEEVIQRICEKHDKLKPNEFSVSEEILDLDLESIIDDFDPDSYY